MYINVIGSALESVSTVYQAVQVFDSFYQLAKRERIKTFLLQKTQDIGLLFLTEVGNVKREFERFRKAAVLPIIHGHPPFSGTALWARGLMLRTQRQYEELGTLCYLPEGTLKTESLKENYVNLYSMLESFCTGVFNDWIAWELKNASGEGELEKKLQQGLLCRVPLPGGSGGFGSLLESNFDKALLKIFQEVYYWEKIQGSGIVVPFNAHDIYSTWRDPLRVTREHVIRVVREYNTVISSLAVEERR